MDHVPAAQIAGYVQQLVADGLSSVIVFGVLVRDVARKDDVGSCALSDASPVCACVCAAALPAPWPILCAGCHSHSRVEACVRRQAAGGG